MAKKNNPRGASQNPPLSVKNAKHGFPHPILEGLDFNKLRESSSKRTRVRKWWKTRRSNARGHSRANTYRCNACSAANTLFASFARERAVNATKVPIARPAWVQPNTTAVRENCFKKRLEDCVLIWLKNINKSWRPKSPLKQRHHTQPWNRDTNKPWPLKMKPTLPASNMR